MRELIQQAGVVARRQLLAVGWSDADVRRAVRRRDLTAVHRGVYVNHTGPLTWEQRAWAAVLVTWPAALCDVSALRAFHGNDGPPSWREDTIHVAIDRHRKVDAPAHVVIHHRSQLTERVAWNLGPPRMHYEDSVIDLAARQRRRIDTVAVLADAVGARRTTARRLAAVIGTRQRMRHRGWLLGVLDDIDSGTWSVLEHGYLDLVERPHGLPPGRRQVRHVGGSGTQYRDVDVPGLAIIELDGRQHHATNHQRDRDMERDLDAAMMARTTLRLGYGQVFDRPCTTAAKVAAVMRLLGWGGRVRACGPNCVTRG